jgi:acetyltransferase-like isoleucine patch superfamily enzyme
MTLRHQLVSEGLWMLSEIEAVFSKPNSLLRLRRRFLRSCGVTHGKRLWVGRGLRLLCHGNMNLGERCALGDFVRIGNHANISIGDDFLGSTGLHLDSGTHDPVTLQPDGREIRIGKRVWCGINVTILAGVTIGDDVVIGAGSVVIADIPPNVIAAGVPARVIRPLERSADQPCWTWVAD